MDLCSSNQKLHAQFFTDVANQGVSLALFALSAGFDDRLNPAFRMRTFYQRPVHFWVGSKSMEGKMMQANVRTLTDGELELVAGGMGIEQVMSVTGALGSAFNTAVQAGNHSLASILAGTHNKLLARAALAGGIAGAAVGAAYYAGDALGNMIYDEYSIQILDAIEWTMGHVNSTWDYMFGS